MRHFRQDADATSLLHSHCRPAAFRFLECYDYFTRRLLYWISFTILPAQERERDDFELFSRQRAELLMRAEGDRFFIPRSAAYVKYSAPKLLATWHV